jgi:protein tyrosine phosphatase type 4A
MISQWLQVVNQAKLQAARQETDHVTVAVHCVAGLGRAPVLVAIALIELGMAPLDAIAYIREKRRGAFNKPQIMFLDSYSSPTYSLRSSLGRMFGFGPKTCAVVTQQT